MVKSDFVAEGMPKAVINANNRWTVYNLYKIHKMTLREHKEIMSKNHGLDFKFDCTPNYSENDFAPYESIWVAPQHGISRIYNPFTDSPEIFLAFASLGKSDRPQKDKVLDFVNKYGDLYFERGIASINTGEWYDGSSVEEFFMEAKIAYYTLCLFEELSLHNKVGIKKLIEFFINNWCEFGLARPDDNNTCDECMEHLNRYDLDNCTGCNNFIATIKKENDIIKNGSLILCEITNRKLHYPFSGSDDAIYYPLLPICTFKLAINGDKNVPCFEMEWPINNLLQAIWLLFFLKITGQIEQPYKICPVCELPITNPRKNQQYHDGCRQVLFNRRKRLAAKLWRDGKNQEEIAEEVDVEMKTLTKWINAFQKQASKEKEEE